MGDGEDVKNGTLTKPKPSFELCLVYTYAIGLDPKIFESYFNLAIKMGPLETRTLSPMLKNVTREFIKAEGKRREKAQQNTHKQKKDGFFSRIFSGKT